MERDVLEGQHFVFCIVLRQRAVAVCCGGVLAGASVRAQLLAWCGGPSVRLCARRVASTQGLRPPGTALLAERCLPAAAAVLK